MNVYRQVTQTENGTVYQCLNCKGQWELTWSESIRFCMYCGVETRKLECREHDTPRWLYEAGQRLDAETLQALHEDVVRKNYYKSRRGFRWVVEERATLVAHHFPQQEWKRKCVLRPDATSHDVLKHLCHCREDVADCSDFCLYEYRARRVKFN